MKAREPEYTVSYYLLLKLHWKGQFGRSEWLYYWPLGFLDIVADGPRWIWQQYIIAAMLGRHVPRGGSRILDLGIREGRNLYYYPKDVIQVVVVAASPNLQLLESQGCSSSVVPFPPHQSHCTVLKGFATVVGGLSTRHLLPLLRWASFMASVLNAWQIWTWLKGTHIASWGMWM